MDLGGWLGVVGLLHRGVLDKAVASLLDSIVSDALVFFVVHCARRIFVEYLRGHHILSRHAKSLALVKPVVPDIHNVVRDACFCLSPLLIKLLECKFSVQALRCGLCLLQGISKRKSVVILVSMRKSSIMTWLSQTGWVLI